MRQQLGLTGREKFDADMQDRLACYLLGQRAIDKWLAGRLSLDTLIRNLAQEWASLPKPAGCARFMPYTGTQSCKGYEKVQRMVGDVGIEPTTPPV